MRRRWKLLIVGVVVVAAFATAYSVSISGGCLFGPSFGLKCAV